VQGLLGKSGVEHSTAMNSIHEGNPGRVLPLLRWAGSKKRQFNKLQPFFPEQFRSYIEPFAGSAAFFFGLQPARACLNDLNRDVTEFYKRVRKNPSGFFRRFSRLTRSRDEYYRIRDQFNSEQDRDRRAVLFYYLNRNCFNGIYRTNKLGEFNVPFSDDRVSPYLAKSEFINSAEQLVRARIFNLDFEVFCKEAVAKGDFVYLDPPYYREGHRVFNEYSKTPFSPADFKRLIATLTHIDRVGAKFLLTFPATSDIEVLGRAWHSKRRRVRRTVAGNPAMRKVQNEMLISNYER
jgi:DNA adenine methylase